ncbi:MAG: YitT family protein [Bacilli bacterium]
MKKETLDYKFYKYAVLTFMMFVAAINYNLFISPAKIVAGGVNGISVILESVFNFSPSITILTISLAILLLALICSQKDIVVSALYASVIYPFFVKITAIITEIIPIEYNDMMLIVIFSGMISGIVAGVTCKLNTSQGGIILISQILYKKFHISIAYTNLLINAIIVVVGGIVFGINNIMYALIFLYVSKIFTDKIILGTSQNKIFYIITTEQKNVENYIKNVLEAGYTIFNIKGGFLRKKQAVIMTTIATRDYFKLKEGIHEIDDKAFIVITDSYQVKGGK